MRLVAPALIAIAAAILVVAVAPLEAQTARQNLIERLKDRSQAAPGIDPGKYVPGATRSTFQYGASNEQTLDVYRPANARDAPIIVMVHGGGWAIGDKNSPGVVENKLAYWLPQGFILVSVDYRLLPEAAPDVQAADVAAALAAVQRNAAAWGGDAARVFLMGHSAGAHLVALLSADPSRVTRAGGTRWLGTVVLDSAGLDVAGVMSAPHARLYDDAFGANPTYWRSVSPIAQVTPGAVPMMLVCSLKRDDDSCGASRAFANRVAAVTGVLPPVRDEPLTHREVNVNLGLSSPYTRAVDDFMAQLLKG